MSAKTFNVSFPKELADLIDQKAKEQFATRSDLLRSAALRYLRDEQEFQEMMKYGKQVGKATGNKSEEAVAAKITADRRKNEVWRKQA
jgi:metal-responsive CopG/Arc/MetJ family transcriptional regulator